MKTKRIAPGYYEGIYKGYNFSITSTYYDHSKETVWYYQINGGEVNDVYSTKKVAMLACEDYINSFLMNIIPH